MTSSDNIGLHLTNIFKEGELNAASVAKEFSVTAADGKNYTVRHYNLDAIIAVGFQSDFDTFPALEKRDEDKRNE